MKLKAVDFHLLFTFADATFGLEVKELAVQKFSIKIDLDPQTGHDSKKGQPGIKNC